jgi:hypothetical protein
LADRQVEQHVITHFHLLTNFNPGFCALDACTNAALAAITTTIATSCGPEFDIPAGQTAEAVQFVQTVFPPTRKVLCLQQYVRLPLSLEFCCPNSL